jgi:hypothetical protein
MQAVETAMSSALGGGSRANIQAAIIALNTLAVNAYDSRYSVEVAPSDEDRGGLHRPGKEIAAIAAEMRSELRAADIDSGTVNRAPLVARTAQRLTTSNWTRLRDLPFTT